MEKRRTRSDAKNVDPSKDDSPHDSPLAKLHPVEYTSYLAFHFYRETFGEFLGRMYGRNRILKNLIPEIPKIKKKIKLEELEDEEAQLPKTREERDAEAPQHAQDEDEFEAPLSPELGEFAELFINPNPLLPGPSRARQPENELQKKRRRRKFPLVGMKKKGKKSETSPKKRKSGEEKSEPEDPLGARVIKIEEPDEPAEGLLPEMPIAAAIPPEAAVPPESKKTRRASKPKKTKETKTSETKSKGKFEKTTSKKESNKKASKIRLQNPITIPTSEIPSNFQTNHLVRGLDISNPYWWAPKIYM